MNTSNYEQSLMPGDNSYFIDTLHGMDGNLHDDDAANNTISINRV